MWGLTGGNQPVLQKSVTDWNSAHPDSSIKLDFFANDAYKTKVRTAVGAGQGPTFIYGWGGGVLKSYVDAGQVDDLSAFLKDNPDVQDRYLPAVLKNGVIDGKTYALPNNNVQPVVLYFNKEVFEQGGRRGSQDLGRADGAGAEVQGRRHRPVLTRRPVQVAGPDVAGVPRGTHRRARTSSPTSPPTSRTRGPTPRSPRR